MNNSFSKDDSSGLLASYRGLSKDDLEIFIKQYSGDNGVIYRFIAELFDSPDDFLRFLDVLSSKTIKIPSLKQSLKIINDIKIWRYLRKREINYQTLRNCANSFSENSNLKITPKKCHQIFLKMESLYGDSDVVDKYQEYPTKSKTLETLKEVKDVEKPKDGPVITYNINDLK